MVDKVSMWNDSALNTVAVFLCFFFFFSRLQYEVAYQPCQAVSTDMCV